MPTAALLPSLIPHLRETATDAQLLDRFTRHRDEAAFAELVRRCGPLVLGVCRRVIPDRHLADDAFQATFVVLARKAAGVRPGGKLASWLYGVAYRVALRARTMAGRRAKRETVTAHPPDAGRADREPDDAAAILDDEIQKLSPALREAVVLCELQGVGRREAAKALGIAEGTLSSRLAAARKALAGRLRSRGVALSAGVLASTAFLSNELLAATVAVSTGKVGLTSHMLKLVEGGSQMTLLNKLKLAAVLFALLAVTAGGIGVWKANESTAAPVPRDEPDSLIWFHDRTANELVGYSPAGKQVERQAVPNGQEFVGVSPDGANILYVTAGTYHLRPFGENTPGVDLGIPRLERDHVVGWTRDGKQFLRGRTEDFKRIIGVRAPNIEYDVIDITARTATRIEPPADTNILGWTPDEQQFLGTSVGIGIGVGQFGNLSLFAPGGKPTPLTLDDHVTPLTFAPTSDGKTLLVGGWKLGKDESPYHAAYRFDPTTGILTELVHEDGQNMTHVAASPDGNRIAVAWAYTPNLPKGAAELRLTVARANGTGRTTLTLRDRSKGEKPEGLHLLGWFPRKRNAPVPKEQADAGLVWVQHAKAGTLTAYTPDGKVEKEVKLPDGQRFLGLTPDGQKVAVVGPGDTVHLRGIGADGDGTDTGLAVEKADWLIWSKDGKKVVRLRNESTRQAKPGDSAYSHVLFDLATKKETTLDLPPRHQVFDFSDDGRWLLTLECIGFTGSLNKVSLDGTKVVPLSTDEQRIASGRLSADGKTAICFGSVGKQPPGGEIPSDCVLSLDLATGVFRAIARHDDLIWCRGFVSPDGKRIAYEWMPLTKGENAPQLVVCDADGENSKTIESGTSDSLLLGWFPSPQKGVDARKRNAPVPKERSEGLIWVPDGTAKKLIGYRSDGTIDTELTIPESAYHRVTPFGRLAFAGKNGRLVAGEANDLTVHLRPLTAGTDGTDTGIPVRTGDGFVWSQDGKQVVRIRVTGVDSSKNGSALFEHTLIDVATRAEKSMTLPKHHRLVGWSPDGTWWLVVEHNGDICRLHRFPTNGDKPTRLTDDYSYTLTGDIAPNGRSVLGFAAGVWNVADGETVVRAAATGGPVEVVAKNAAAIASGGSWSPDGRRIAYVVVENAPDGNEKWAWVKKLIVCDANGSNARVLRTWEKKDRNDDGFARITCAWLPAAPKADPPTKKPTRLTLSVSGTLGEKKFYDDILSVDPATGEWTKLADGGYQGRVSPDGQTLVYEKDSGTWNVGTDGSNNPGKVLDYAAYGGVFWTRDGKHLLGSRVLPGSGSNLVWVHETRRFPAGGGEGEAVNLPRSEAVLDVSPDGKTYLTRSRPLPSINSSVLIAMDAAGKNKVQLSEGSGFNEPARFAADGKRIAYVCNDKAGHTAWVVDADGKNRTKVFHEAGGYIEGVCWDPTGDRVAVIAAVLGEKGRIPFGDKAGNWRVLLVSADGKEATPVPLKLDAVRSIRSPDWFAPPAR